MPSFNQTMVLLSIILLFAALFAATYYYGTKGEPEPEPMPVHPPGEPPEEEPFLLTISDYQQLHNNIHAGVADYSPAAGYLVPGDKVDKASKKTLFTFMLFVHEADS